MSTLPVHSPALFSALFDDAAMFPPGNASPAQALSRHERHRAGRHGPFIGPLVVSEARWESFLDAYADRGSPRLEVIVVGAASPVTDLPASLRISGYEVMANGGVMPKALRTLPVAVEIQDVSGRAEVLGALTEARRAGSPWIAKFRTGGTSADAFPDERALASSIAATFDAGVPFKLTAGLHCPVRHTDVVTGFEHHGFLNVLAAVRRCIAGGSQEALTSVLADRDSNALVAELARWTTADAESVRSMFASFGCCGVDEPLAAAVRLGLIAEETS